MFFDMSDPEQTIQAADFLAEVGARGKTVDIKVVRQGRTLPQNAYLHVLLGGIGNYLGYNLDEMKTEYKRTICPSIYIYEKNGKRFTRSSAELTKEDMSKSIDKLRTFAAEQGYPLPTESDINWIRQLQNDLEKVNYYL